MKFNKFNNTSWLVKKSDYNAKITETPSISGLATNVALTAVQNKIPKISSLVRETDYNLKTTEIEKKLTDHNHDKYITVSEFNKLTVGVLHARLARPNLVTRKILMINWEFSIKKVTQIKQSTFLLKMNWKRCKHLIQFILDANIILKKMVHKII